MSDHTVVVLCCEDLLTPGCPALFWPFPSNGLLHNAAHSASWQDTKIHISHSWVGWLTLEVCMFLSICLQCLWLWFMCVPSLLRQSSCSLQWSCTVGIVVYTVALSGCDNKPAAKPPGHTLHPAVCGTWATDLQWATSGHPAVHTYTHMRPFTVMGQLTTVPVIVHEPRCMRSRFFALLTWSYRSNVANTCTFFNEEHRTSLH